MAANQYYNPSARPEHEEAPAPYYQPYNPPENPPLSTAPSYHTQPPSRNPSARPSDASPVSPFETPFDDRVYSMGRPMAPHGFDSQSSLGDDSRYYGQGGGGRQGSTGSFRDDIPLRDHPQVPAKDNYSDDVDHVYDAPTAPAHLEEARPKRNSGGLGFMQAGKKKSKWNIAWVCYIFGTIQFAVFIAELVTNAKLTGSPIEIKPNFNPMIGPSPYVLINMGSRYMPCMHNIPGIQSRTTPINWPCPNTTSDSVADCTLSDLCGLGGVPNPLYNGNSKQSPEPNQWYRFIIPIFLHAGIIHIGFNMLLQFTLGREMEISIGSVRFLLVYVASGIFGFVLGGNFAAVGISSTGASGSLFGVLALTLLDLLYSWKERQSPFKDLAFIALDVIISFVLGLLPGLDNFSHIGGFLMGIVLGICILHSPNALRKRIEQDEPPYTPVAAGYKAGDGQGGEFAGVARFVKSPVGFFKGRKVAWWVWWLMRVGGLVAVTVVFIVLLNNFYIYRKTCSWCKYLSCININHWCDIGNLQFNNNTSKRSILDSWDAMAKLYEAAV